MTNIQTHKQNRYNRQIQVPQIGETGQQKLTNAHVAIIGMGGLGCPASLYLAGAGIGKLTLIDHDVVSISNLHRQILYKETDVGKYKTDVAKKTLIELNNDIQIIRHANRLTAGNIDSLLADANVVVDAADNFAISYLLSDYAEKTNKPLVSASVIGVHGYLGVFCNRTNTNIDTGMKGTDTCVPSMRAVFPSPPDVGQDCNSVGVIGTSAGIMGTLQAQEVIRVVLGDTHQLAGKLLSLNLWTHHQSIMDFNSATEPLVIASIIDAKQITAKDITIDVRTAEEINAQPKTPNHIINANILHIPMADFLEDIQATIANHLPKNNPSKRIVLTCTSGQRALNVADKLIEKGFSNVAVWL